MSCLGNGTGWPRSFHFDAFLLSQVLVARQERVQPQTTSDSQGQSYTAPLGIQSYLFRFGTTGPEPTHPGPQSHRTSEGTWILRADLSVYACLYITCLKCTYMFTHCRCLQTIVIYIDRFGGNPWLSRLKLSQAKTPFQHK